ncbi:MAG TPA: DeoR/GlpR family DNA-binding transcription regulator [Firmicutes bacterium]|nr:DeoR/GlpR family DNA-binding transcription regulator [Bacillota bacterium]
MFSNERYNLIFDYLKNNRKATVDELAGFLYVSSATIRRDLKEMQKLGLIVRSHGGALLRETANEVSIFVRREKNAREKELAAQKAMPYVAGFQSVFIDNSSTCLILAEKLNLENRTVITNGLQIAMRLTQKQNVNLIMPGGVVHYNTNSVTGGLTCNTLRNLRVDLALVSAAAVDEDGTYEHSLETAQIKQLMFRQAKRSMLVVDGTKFGMPGSYRTASLADYDTIVTDAPDAVIAKYRDKGIAIVN